MKGLETAQEFLQTSGVWILENMSVEGIVSLPALMVGFLVAIAIYNFEDSCKGLSIDPPTVISRVVGVNSVLLAIFLVSLLPLAWGSWVSLFWLLPLFVIAYILGLFLLVHSLQRAFKWAKSIETGTQDSFRSTKRAEYMESLDDAEKRAAWEKIWQADGDTRKLFDQRHFIKLFTASVKQVKDKRSHSPWLVQDFISAIDTIHLDDPIIMYELVDFCLEAMLDERKHSEKFAAGDLYYYSNLRRLFFRILDTTLEKNDNSLYMLMARSREYITENNLNEANFIKSFAPNFIASVAKKDDQYSIWETFPEEWKVTPEKLQGVETRDVALAWLNSYSRWLSSKTLYRFKESDELDFKIDNVTNELLPTIDTIDFSRLFAFQWAAHGVAVGESSEHAQVRNFVENRLAFGHVGHSFTTYGDNHDDALKKITHSEREALMDLVAKTTLFPSLRNKAQISKYIRAIKDIEEERRGNTDIIDRLRWLDATLKSIRKKINQLAKKVNEN